MRSFAPACSAEGRAHATRGHVRRTERGGVILHPSAPGDRRLRERREGEKSSYAAQPHSARPVNAKIIGEIRDRIPGGTTAVAEPNPPGKRSET